MTTLRPPTGRLCRARRFSAGTDADKGAPSCSDADDVRASSAGRPMKGSPVNEEHQQSEDGHLSRSATTGQQQGHDGHVQALKSAKRRAAEALLAARMGGGAPPVLDLEALQQPFPAQALAAATPGGLRQVCTTSMVSSRRANGGACVVAACCCCSVSTGGKRLVCSSSLESSDSQSTGTGGEGPEAPSAADAAGISGGLSLLQRQADSMAAAASGHHAKVPKTAAAAAAAAVSRQPVSTPGPPSKRARLSLSAAAASSLGPGLLGTAHTQKQPAGAAAAAAAAAATTRVPPCDAARGCKAQLREAAEAAAAAASKRRASAPAALRGGDGAEGDAVDGGVSSGLAGPAPRPNEPVWCSFDVNLPSVNWQAVFDEPPGALQRYSLARGYEKLVLPQGLVSYVVEQPRHMGDALRHLKASMQDRLVAIDLEWRPEFMPGRSSPVALLQLSTARVCVAVRLSAMGYALPTELEAFLRDGDGSGGHVLLGFGWDLSDEAKLRSTFGLGRADFGKFLDLQDVAASLGYHGFGLSRLSQQVLGLPLVKSKSISRSNWAAPQLTNHQLKYASLDVLVAGQLFRALRLWHSSPSPCADCRTPIGELLLPGPLRCGHPACSAKPAASLPQHTSHCANTGHPPRFAACGACGRLHELQASTGTRKA